MAVDVKTGEERMLLEDARIGEIAFNPVDRSLIGVRHAFGVAVLVRVPYPYTEWHAVHAFPYESVPNDLDISPDGKAAVGVDERGQRPTSTCACGSSTRSCRET